MLKSARSGDMVAGGLLCLLGLVTFLAATRISEGAGGQLHPRTFPMLLAALTAAGGLWLLGHGAAARTAGKRVDWPDQQGWRNWWAALGLMLAYVGLMKPLGFLITTFIFVTICIAWFGRYRWYVAAALGLGTVLFIYVVFIGLLQLPFPMGPLDFLA